MISEVGRSGSGERGGRRRCEDCAAIDVRVLHRHAPLGQLGTCASLRWHRGSKQYTEVIILTRTPCHYGGTRPWFCCPGCQRRCAKLYLRGDRFRCRACHGLAYRSQLEASAERPRLIAHRIRRSLGASPDLLVPFPAKPPKMHWRTYFRIRARGERFEARAMARLTAWVRGFKRL
jgi:hypothetical protein